MFYFVSSKNAPLVLATCTTIEAAETAFAAAYEGEWCDLKTAISKGALIRAISDGKQAWLGVNLQIRMEDHAFQAKWLGKWRSLSYWSRTATKPSDKWITDKLERVFRLNAGLHAETRIIYRWHTAE